MGIYASEEASRLEQTLEKKVQEKTGSVVFQAKKAQFVTFAYASYGKMTTDNALVYFRGAFGDDAARFAQEKLQALKKANLKGKVADKMKIAYKYSLYQVGQFADMAEKMEAAYFGTSLVSKLLL